MQRGNEEWKQWLRKREKMELEKKQEVIKSKRIKLRSGLILTLGINIKLKSRTI